VIAKMKINKTDDLIIPKSNSVKDIKTRCFIFSCNKKRIFKAMINFKLQTNKIESQRRAFPYSSNKSTNKTRNAQDNHDSSIV